MKWPKNPKIGETGTHTDNAHKDYTETVEDSEDGAENVFDGQHGSEWDTFRKSQYKKTIPSQDIFKT